MPQCNYENVLFHLPTAFVRNDILKEEEEEEEEKEEEAEGRENSELKREREREECVCVWNIGGTD